MTDQPPRDREVDPRESEEAPPHPSPAEDVGEAVDRPPRPSQAEGDREDDQAMDRLE
jgi:hypothetical protein